MIFFQTGYTAGQYTEENIGVMADRADLPNRKEDAETNPKTSIVRFL